MKECSYVWILFGLDNVRLNWTQYIFNYFVHFEQSHANIIFTESILFVWKNRLQTGTLA